MPDQKVVAGRGAAGAETNEAFGRSLRGLQIEAARRLAQIHDGVMAEAGYRIASPIRPQNAGSGRPPCCHRDVAEIDSEFTQTASPIVGLTQID